MALYPNRDSFHRWMGPPEEHQCCYGRGWTVSPGEDGVEVYCECECGDERRRVDGYDDKHEGGG